MHPIYNAVSLHGIGVSYRDLGRDNSEATGSGSYINESHSGNISDDDCQIQEDKKVVLNKLFKIP